MPSPPSTNNYQVGGALVSIGGLDLGNIVSLEVDPTDITLLEHYTSRSGARKLDKQVVTQKRFHFNVELDEHQADLYRKYFMGGNVGPLVDVMTLPLVETNVSVIYRNEAGTIWTYSHTRCLVSPAGPMNFGNFDDWGTYQLRVEALEDTAAAPATMGRITFGVYP